MSKQGMECAESGESQARPQQVLQFIIIFSGSVSGSALFFLPQCPRIRTALWTCCWPAGSGLFRWAGWRAGGLFGAAKLGAAKTETQACSTTTYLPVLAPVIPAAATLQVNAVAKGVVASRLNGIKT